MPIRTHMTGMASMGFTKANTKTPVRMSNLRKCMSLQL